MLNFISGTIFGIVVSTIGFAPVATLLDGAMLSLKKSTIEMNAPQPLQLPPAQ